MNSLSYHVLASSSAVAPEKAVPTVRPIRGLTLTSTGRPGMRSDLRFLDPKPIVDSSN
jgi:hypothetical protein